MYGRLRRKFLIGGMIAVFCTVMLGQIAHWIPGARRLPESVHFVFYLIPALVLLLVPLWFALERWIFRPLARVVWADQRCMQGHLAEGIIPEETVADDEIGVMVRSRNTLIRWLLTEQQRLAELLERLPEGVVLVNRTRRIAYINRIGQTYIRALVPGSDTAAVGRALPGDLERLLDPTRIQHQEIITPSSPPRTLEVRAAPLTQGPLQGGWIVTLWDITRRKRLLEQLIHTMLYDPKTDLPNRLMLRERLRLILGKARRMDRPYGVVLVIDCDRFQWINEAFGYAAGDQILHTLARRLERIAVEPRVVAYLGEDEFALLLEGERDLREIVRVTRTVLRRLNRPVHLDGQTIPVSVSIGVATITPRYRRPEEILRDAEIAMYRAKHRGRAQFALFSRKMQRRAREYLQAEALLQHAVHNGELRVHFQPILSLRDRRLIAAEALVRWPRAPDGWHPTHRWIRLAEWTGLIREIDRWTLDAVCRHLQVWTRDGMSDFRVAINVSALQLYHPEFRTILRQCLQHYGIAPDRLILELTERHMLRNLTGAERILRDLVRDGFHIAVDDFGTGYSSLLLLRALPIHIVKLDQWFIRDLPEDRAARAIVRCLVEMAHEMDKWVIAEGVETHRQFYFLRDVGCDAVQGYLCAPPVPAARFPELIQIARQYALMSE